MDYKKYIMKLEVASMFGKFKRPDSGSSSTSFIIPPPTAVKGMFENIFYLPSVEVVPVECKICFEPEFVQRATNSKSWMRKRDTLKDDAACMMNESVLWQPVYQLTAYARPSHISGPNPRINYPHAYQEQALRRIGRRTSKNVLCMGTKEFVCSYWGEARKETQVNTTINTVVRNMYISIYNRPVAGTAVAPKFHDIQIINGIAVYPEGQAE